MIDKLEKKFSQVYVEIFAIGNELCYGRIYDTNSFWIAEQVTQLGANVQRITCVPDDIGIICTSIKEATSRNPHFIITTGGLGPTPDDLTIDALSEVVGLEIITSQKILEAIAQRRKVSVEQLTPNLVRMARSLKGAETLPNPVGWAPVTIVNNGESTIVAFPGPPQEMKGCFTEYLANRIREKTGCESESKRVFVGMYESQLSPIIEEIKKCIPYCYLKPLVSEYQRDKGLPVDITAFAENKQACQKKIDEIIKRLEEFLTKNGS